MNFQTPILIVDDHQTMRKSIAFILRDLGFNNLFYAEDALWKTTGADGWAVDARDAVIIARQWLEQTEHRHGFRVS
ncbi:hypothetical protein [Desulfonatronovibrio magnus]|uniref:hypothetical protein n=1 Tax=Desulfonatronovibrio magnus TaxID=698827 RepID=UPI0005EB70D6